MIAQDAVSCVALGTGKALDNLDKLDGKTGGVLSNTPCTASTIIIAGSNSASNISLECIVTVFGKPVDKSLPLIEL